MLEEAVEAEAEAEEEVVEVVDEVEAEVEAEAAAEVVAEVVEAEINTILIIMEAGNLALDSSLMKNGITMKAGRWMQSMLFAAKHIIISKEEIIMMVDTGLSIRSANRIMMIARVCLHTSMLLQEAMDRIMQMSRVPTQHVAVLVPPLEEAID